ncbi:MAG: response regulator transcription factor [Microthrixaceae bacterium]|nr:response regulator transcription factor [Microthrixaceae bacterium]
MTVGAVAALLCGDDVAASAWLSQAAVTWENYGPRHHVALLSARDRRLLWEFARERNTRLVLNYLDIPSTSVTIAGPAAVTLSPRENIVLTALVTHRSARDIAEELVVSPHTVKSQLQSLYRKLGVSSRRSALAVAFELGFIDAQRTD